VIRRGAILLAGLLLAGGLAGCSIPRWPVEGELTSPFGVRWRGLLPGLHRGVDIDVPTGTPVRAMSAGRVRFAGEMSGYGLVVWLEHGGEVLTNYAHLSRLEVRTGDPVEAGQVIALSGASGNAEGPHLHFEIWRWGREVDPVPLLGGFPG
jgi:murein DD-endopeptidase MepM/ murein hydrolase activator NlpD